MSTITYNDNGEQRTVPLWATESQMERLIAGLDIKDNGKQQKTTEKQTIAIAAAIIAPIR